jgi:probable 2-oxoglutarate dehydrogenase E1 component DHKTD1
MYKAIKNKKETVELLKENLLKKNLINFEAIKNLEDKYMKILNDELTFSKTFQITLEDIRNDKFKGNKTLIHKWKEMNFPQFCKSDNELVTGLNNVEDVKKILEASIKLPDTFKVHPRLMQFFINGRLSQIEKGFIDWPSAEIAAFGSLLREGFNVRISGQDVTRGTFSQRHIGLFDQQTNEVYHPLGDKNNFESRGRLEVNNSTLSEFGMMLFEYGYSLESPKNCVIWEAQFGDFVNGAQVFLQFITLDCRRSIYIFWRKKVDEAIKFDSTSSSWI